MGWIDFRKHKPKDDIMALVANEKYWMSYVRAIYQPDHDTWVLVDPNYRECPVLEVTHYIEIPNPPFKNASEVASEKPRKRERKNK